MSRNYGYGSLGRRSGSAAWQWVVIGMILGFMCSAVVVIGGLAAGFLSLDPAAVAANQATQTPFIITATPEPVTPTDTPTITPSPTHTEEIPLNVAAPTASPTVIPTLLTPAPTATTATSGGQSGGGLTSGGAGAQLLPGQTPQNVTGVQPSGVSESLRTIASEVRLVTGGEFQMGTTPAEVVQAVDECTAGYGGAAGACQLSYGEDAQPQHPVTVSSFNMEVTEVTYAQYVAFLNEMGPGSHRNGCFGLPCVRTNIEAAEVSEILFDSANYSVTPALNNFPVSNVSWFGARAYCEAIGRRLPTEAEWERAARGDDGRIFPWGNLWNPDYAATSRSTNPVRVPVTEYSNVPSVYGQINLAGNVAEWVNDWYGDRYYSLQQQSGNVIDPQGPSSGSQRVVRGGAWSSVPFFSRTPHRQSWEPNDPQPWIGFRCVEDIDATAGASGNTTGTLPGQVDPATLGITDTTGGTTSEESAPNAQPTLPPAPVIPATATSTLAP